MRVLVAESEPTRKAAIAAELAQESAVDELTEVSDGMAAATGAAGYDVVIIDLDIWGLGSLGAIERICRIDHAPAVLAIDSTGNKWKDYAARAEGASDVLRWPSDAAKLRQRLSALADGRRAPAPVEAAPAGRRGLRRDVPSLR